MPLDYLDFDYSEDTEGVGVFDAMASAAPERLAALHAEVARVLAWAHEHFPDRRGAVGEDGDWDYDLQALREDSRSEILEFDEASGRIEVRPGPVAGTRHTVTLSISGTPDFCAAFRARFGAG